MPEREEGEEELGPGGAGDGESAGEDPVGGGPVGEGPGSASADPPGEEGSDSTRIHGIGATVPGTEGALMRMAFGDGGGTAGDPASGGWAPAPLGVGDVLGGRYTLEGELGQGGFGSVFRARDRIGRDGVAVKVLKASATHIRDMARREIGVLRFLQVPGVARLRDEGTERGCPYFVMDLVEGDPFPGTVVGDSVPVAWEALVPVAMSLLEVLGRVHGLGLVHLDLKPANVLVDREGRVSLLDFGISEGAALGDLAGHTDAATKEYASPEKIRGGATSVRSDLYALGVMLYRTLTGERPCPLDSAGVPQFQQTTSITVHLPGLSRSIAEWIDRLLSVDPAARPVSIHSGLRVLSGETETAPEDAGWRSVLASADGSGAPRERYTERELWEVFEGPDIVLHLREDGARELWRRTLGCPDRIDAVLSAWERSGLAHRVGPRYSVRRMALERLKQGTRIAPPPLRRESASRALDELELRILRTLEVDWPEGSSERLGRILELSPEDLAAPIARLVQDGWVLAGPGLELHPVALEEVSMILPEDHLMVARAQEPGEPKRLYHWIEAGELDSAVKEALVVGPSRMNQGCLAEAESVLRDGLVAAQLAVHEEGERQLLRQLFEVSMVQLDDASLDRTLFELARTSSPSTEIGLLEDILEAAIAGRASAGVQAVELMESLPEFDDRDLEGWRGAVLSQAYRRVSIDASREFISRMERLPDGALGRNQQERLHNWRGGQLYLEYAFEESAREYARATECALQSSTRGANIGNEATSWLEAGDPARAAELAEEMLEWAVSRRNGVLETWAHWIFRTAAYRRGEDLMPLAGWLEAVDVGSSVVMRAPIHMQEASFHWRAGNFVEGQARAEAAHRVWRDSADTPGMLLSAAMYHRCARSLGFSTDSTDPNLMDLDPLVESCELPRILAQSVALLRPVFRNMPQRWVALGRARLRELSVTDAQMRWEALSIREMSESLDSD